MLTHHNTATRTPKIQTPSSQGFDLKKTQKNTSIQINRLKSQIQKKLNDGTTGSVFSTVQSELGWMGLCILASCVIFVCIVVFWIVSNNTSFFGSQHPRHPIYKHVEERNVFSHINAIDPESVPSREYLDRNKNKKQDIEKKEFKNAQNSNGNTLPPIPNEPQVEINKDALLDPKGKKSKHEKENKEKTEQSNNNVNKNKAVKRDEPGLTNDEMPNFVNIMNHLNTVDLSKTSPAEDSASLDEKAYRVKTAFLHAWHGYAKFAMGHDEILPVSDLPGDSWGGLGATLIDALDTMMIMHIKEEFVEARANLMKINFDQDLQVSFFETTIRHLGGLLGAYELSRLLGHPDNLFLEKAQQLIDHLLPAFNTPKGLPRSLVDLKTGETKNYGWTKDRNILSEVGSNSLEFYAMSHHTSDGKYYLKAKHVLDVLNQMDKPEMLYARLIEPESGEIPRNEKVYTIGGMADSFYEYLLKTWIVTNYRDTDALEMYINSLDAINEKLLRQVADKTRREEPFYFYGELWYNKFRGRTEELTCFMPGALALGAHHISIRQKQAETNNIPLKPAEKALLARRDTHLKLAHVLAESCYQLYQSTPTGLAPESIQFDENGWHVKEPRYQLRPETIESLFILFSVTQNEEYRRWAWNIFENIEKHCRTEVAFSGIKDVRDIPTEKDNKMESFVMAETFKYLFLLFDDYAMSALKLNQFVFNTEAHPIQIFDLQAYPWGNIKNDDENNSNGKTK